MTTATRTRLFLTADAATLALTGGVVDSASAASSVAKATKLLQGKRLTGYIEGRHSEATIERNVDFCRGGRLFYRRTSAARTRPTMRLGATGGW